MAAPPTPLPVQHGSLAPEAGLDEAGRGALAGPVVAAAVILPPAAASPELRDSKTLSAEKRHDLRARILRGCLAWGIGIQSVAAIDQHNILQASIRAMHEAVAMLSRQLTPAALAVDGSCFRPYDGIPHATGVKGDGRYAHIAAASILAKVFRDELMQGLHAEFPAYGWASNKGYGSAAHREAVRRFGRSPWHRRSFRCGGEPRPQPLPFPPEEAAKS